MKFSEIPQITNTHYRVDVFWKYLQEHLDLYQESYGLDLDPDFQRAHVWSRSQQIAYIEYILRRGMSGREIYFNCPGFQGMSNSPGPMVLVDGKQRLNAVQMFLANRLPAFGFYHGEFEGSMPFDYSFSVWVNNLKTKQEVLQWYIDLNSGVAHTTQEIEKVKRMLEDAHD